MLIGRGGDSRVWHPPRKDSVIEKKYHGKKDLIQRLTREDISAIAHGQFARTVFDPTDRHSSPLIALYKRPGGKHSEIRPHREDDLDRLLIENTQRNDLTLFCTLASNLFEMTKGLAVLHQRGWVHHDIKTGNILYDKHPLRLYLIDWGTAVPFTHVYDDSFSTWFPADNTNHPPEYKSYATKKHGYKLRDNDFATDYAGNIQLFTLLKIQPRYMRMLNEAHRKILPRLHNKKFLEKIAPKADVFGAGLVLAQCYLVTAYALLYDKPVHKQIVRLIHGMTHPDPTRRWTMSHAATSLTPIVRRLCAGRDA